VQQAACQLIDRPAAVGPLPLGREAFMEESRDNHLHQGSLTQWCASCAESGHDTTGSAATLRGRCNLI
jgi:hypothetical protein